MTSPAETVNLENCDREPIHIPGSIQPHGALIALDRLGRLTHVSENVRQLLGCELVPGTMLRADAFASDGQPQPAVYQAISDALHRERAARAFVAKVNGAEFDVVLNRNGDALICEFEGRESGADLSSFAQLAYGSLEELKRAASIQALLDTAVSAVREMTGFDRVMGYRFAYDDSGEVLSEARTDALDPFLGRRYPASDIPAQARRLYVLNTLRLIADVAYKPVPILAAAGRREPLDLSYSVLRSVSPIHVEYLTNMGVHASMSVSIVIGGKLWGMIACHHMAPKLVPYPVRMAVDVMAQVIAATIQSITASERESAIARAAYFRSEAVSAVAEGVDIVELVVRDSSALKAALPSDALLLALDGAVRVDDGVDPEWAQAVCTWLNGHGDPLVHVFSLADLPPWPAHVPRDERFCGLLALRLDERRGTWLVALRRERVLTIRWGGKPDKVIAHGPLGPRLTPRGSFDEWRETVRDTASPWNAIELEIATQLREALERAIAAKSAEQDALRSQVWAMLGHDLRNPLQSINMANRGIERGLDPDRLNSVIRNSTVRMNRLLSDVLDLSRLQRGQGLTFTMEQVDLGALLRQLLEEISVAHAAVAISSDIPERLLLQGDAGRLSQLFANLLSNARHHGRGDIAVSARVDAQGIVVVVSNKGDPIPEALAASLFDPFKNSSLHNPRNRTGMGLGLYIAHQVAIGHSGTIDYVPGEGTVSFVVSLPGAPVAEGGGS